MNKTPFFATFFFFLILPLFSQVNQFKIEKVNYTFSKSTSPRAVEHILDWDYTRIFKSEEELNAYIHTKKQILINKKVFKSIYSSFSLISETQKKIKLVQIELILEESWTIIPYPIFTFDSNLGTVTGLSLVYDNFFGTMTNMNFKGYYSPKSSLLELKFDEIRLGPINFSTGFSQNWEKKQMANEEGEQVLEYNYTKSLFDMSFSIPIFPWLNYVANPAIYVKYNYNFIENDSGAPNSYYTENGAVPAYYQFLDLDTVNWYGNLRQGIHFSFENAIEWDPISEKVNTWVEGILSSYLHFNNINLDTRVSSFWYLDRFRDEAGAPLRGILDYKMSGDYGFYLNQNFTFSILNIDKVGSLQLSPFFDFGYAGFRADGFNPKQLQYTTGINLVAFPQFISNLQLSLVYGLDLKQPKDGEFLFMVGLFF